MDRIWRPVFEDVRTYREKQMRDTGLQLIFPLWGQPTRDLAKQMIASGVRAKLTCIDTQKLDASFVGREFDENLLADLPTESIHAARTASFTRLYMQVRCSLEISRYRSARALCEINLCLPI
jgi:hypothetical protein